jgi:hypothetical protein
LVTAASVLHAAELKPETAAAFDRYVKLTEDGYAQNQGYENFLWLDRHPQEKTLVWLQQRIVRPMQTLDHAQEIEVPDGVIQHWFGAVYLEKEDADADHLRGLLTNFAGYKDFFKQQIVESKVVKQEGDRYDFSLRFYKKQFSTVVLNVDETAKLTIVDPKRWWVACHSTRIGEAGHPRNKKKLDEERAPEDAAGYLWRMNFYWRVQQADNGVYVELARQAGGLVNPSRILTGFQNFPHELAQYLMETLEMLFPHHR